MSTLINLQRLQLSAYQPLNVTGGVLSAVDDDLIEKIDVLSFNSNATWGYDQLQFILSSSKMAAEQWFRGGIGRHILLHSPEGVIVWEGFADQLTLNVGSLSVVRGSLIDTTANKIKVVYSTIDTSTSPPTMGVRAETAWQTDPVSQAKYGIIEKVISVGGCTPQEAIQIRDVAMIDLSDPTVNETDNFVAQATTSVTVLARGYWKWLDAYHYESQNKGAQNANLEIIDVLAADPNGLLSVNPTNIIQNTTQVARWEDDLPKASSRIKAIVSRGDAANDRWIFGVYAGRQSRYNAIPSTPKYSRTLGENWQTVKRYGGIGRVPFYEIDPGQWIFYDDLLPGDIPTRVPRNDPRYLFIESIAYQSPNTVIVVGSRVSQTRQIMGQLGLMGGT